MTNVEEGDGIDADEQRSDCHNNINDNNIDIIDVVNLFTLINHSYHLQHSPCPTRRRSSQWVSPRSVLTVSFLHRFQANAPGALKATKRAGLQPAMDHILANAENPVPSAEELAAEDAEALNSAVDGLEEAKSIKCSDCGKMFRSQATASFHAEKSGHENFEESTEEVSAPTHLPCLIPSILLLLTSLDQAPHRGRESGQARGIARTPGRETRRAGQGGRHGRKGERGAAP
jgi:hypothetical protein